MAKTLFVPGTYGEDLANAICDFGWAIADPWSAEYREGAWYVVDAGPICVACGQAAPPDKDNRWPVGDTFRDPKNHADDCPLRPFLTGEV